MNQQTDRLNYYLQRVQDYVDGTMSRRDAVEFYLLSRKNERLRREVEAYRAIAPGAKRGAELDRLRGS